MRIEGRKKLGLIAGTVAAVLIGSGIAVAYWTTTGTGSGSASVGTTLNVTIAQTGPITGLFPDGPAEEIDFSITNPNPGPVRISTVTVAVSGVVEDPGASGPNPCVAGDFQITQPSAINADVAVGTTPYPSTITGAEIQMIDNGNDQNRCKNASIVLSYTTP